MPKGRLPSPRHITRYEHEDLNGGRGRSSHYSHGIKVPDDTEKEVRNHGKVVIERTKADYARQQLSHAERWRGYQMHPESKARYERDVAGNNGEPYDRSTWTVGHIVWPGDEPGPCPDCPHGRASE